MRGLAAVAGAHRDLFIANSKETCADRRNIALTFQVGDKDTSSPAALRAMHADGEVQAIADAGFTNRVMFGSDRMVWPGTIARHLLQQRRALRSSQQEVIARHHLF